MDISALVKMIISTIMSIVTFFASMGGLPVLPNGENLDMNKFTLAWSDEFDGSALNSDKWEGHFCYGDTTTVRRGSYWNKSLATVTGGNLHIATKYMPDGVNGNGLPGWYTYGLDTNGKYLQKYGYFEVRCILPKGVGQWSAFWMLADGMSNTANGGTDGAEIDIFESSNYAKTGLEHKTISSNIHINGYGEFHESENVCEAIVSGNNPYEEFNTYGLEWNENEYIFYINGVESGRSSFGGASQVPEYMILSVEVGGENAIPSESWAGASIETNTEPLTDFVVDYVRAYSYK